ncbi:MAG: phage tail tape measure protein, partial [Acetanaerobacterium sp.]
MADDKVKGVGNTLADNKVIYEVRADNSKLDGDLKQANSKTSGAAGKLSGIAKTAGLAIGGAVFEAGAAVVKFGSEFETSMAMASTLFGETTVDSDALNKKMLDLSSSTGVAANEMGGALYQALSAGVPVTEDMGSALEFLDKSNNLAKGSGTDFTTVIDTETSVLNAYKMGVGELDNVQKVLLQTQNNGKTTVAELGASLAQVTPTAAAMGVGFDQVGAALATMTTQSTPTAQATTQLNSLFEELGESGTNAANNLDEATKGTQYAGM